MCSFVRFVIMDHLNSKQVPMALTSDIHLPHVMNQNTNENQNGNNNKNICSKKVTTALTTKTTMPPPIQSVQKGKTD